LYNPPILLIVLPYTLYYIVRLPKPAEVPTADADIDQLRRFLSRYKRIGPVAIRWPIPRSVKIALFALAALATVPLLLHGYLVSVGQLTWGAAVIGTLRQLASMLIGIMAVNVVGNVFWKGILDGLPLLRRLVWTLTTFYVLVLLLALLNGVNDHLDLPGG
jgi:hypothetical protein